MPLLSRETIKEIVCDALKVIADFDGDFEDYDYYPFDTYHKQVFINEIAVRLSKSGIEVALSMGRLTGSIGDLIDYIKRRQVYYGINKEKVKLS